MPITINSDGVPIRLWARFEELDSHLLRQLRNVAALPCVVHHVAVMPDVHAGRGATVGSVIAMRGALAPAAVGVDIGCGMAAVRTSLRARDLPDDLRRLRLEVEAAIPVGKASHRVPVWEEASEALRAETRALLDRFGALAPAVARLDRRAAEQLGTLGGGNHFIEICIGRTREDVGGCGAGDAHADSERVWLMLHSGSRHMGAALAEHHIEIAHRLRRGEGLRDPDLAVLLAGMPEFAAYRRDVFWAQEYARLNRAIILERLQAVVRRAFPAVAFEAPISCHHNYVAEEVHFGEEVLVTRKGAIRAGVGEWGIVPGSMGSKSFIVRGRGCAASFQSASHGAGRRMSRTEARRRFSLADLRAQTEGIECRKDAHVIDEAPRAYKNIDRVMAAQEDLVEIVAELRQVVCVKG